MLQNLHLWMYVRTYVCMYILINYFCFIVLLVASLVVHCLHYVCSYNFLYPSCCVCVRVCVQLTPLQECLQNQSFSDFLSEWHRSHDGEGKQLKRLLLRPQERVSMAKGGEGG